MVIVIATIGLRFELGYLTFFSIMTMTLFAIVSMGIVDTSIGGTFEEGEPQSITQIMGKSCDWKVITETNIYSIDCNADIVLVNDPEARKIIRTVDTKGFWQRWYVHFPLSDEYVVTMTAEDFNGN